MAISVQSILAQESTPSGTPLTPPPQITPTDSPIGGPPTEPTPLPTQRIEPTEIPIIPTSVPVQYYPPVGSNQTVITTVSPTPIPPTTSPQAPNPTPTPVSILTTNSTNPPREHQSTIPLLFAIQNPLSIYYNNTKLDQPTQDTLLFSAVLFITYGLYLLRNDIKMLSQSLHIPRSFLLRRRVYG